jgi:hypothetical protein
MRPKLGLFKPDNYAQGPAPQSRTDIYILALNQCRLRNGSCVPISGGALAAHIAAPPCDRSPAGPLTTSGSLIVPASGVPASAGPSKFRGTMAHELFHRVQGTINAEARGFTCTPTGDPSRRTRTWLTESGATWAEFAFVPDDDPDQRRDGSTFFRRSGSRTPRGCRSSPDNTRVTTPRTVRSSTTRSFNRRREAIPSFCSTSGWAVGRRVPRYSSISGSTRPCRSPSTSVTSLCAT